jgi:hypothetical protein
MPSLSRRSRSLHPPLSYTRKSRKPVLAVTLRSQGEGEAGRKVPVTPEIPRGMGLYSSKEWLSKDLLGGSIFKDLLGGSISDETASRV